MFNRVVSIVLITAIAMSLLKFTVPYLWYASNYDYIVTNLCVNKDNPDHECDGYCQLQKRVKEQHNHDDSDHQNKAPQRTSHDQRIDMYHDKLSNTIPSPKINSGYLGFFDFTDLSATWNPDVITPPPQLV